VPLSHGNRLSRLARLTLKLLMIGLSTFSVRSVTMSLCVCYSASPKARTQHVGISPNPRHDALVRSSAVPHLARQRWRALRIQLVGYCLLHILHTFNRVSTAFYCLRYAALYPVLLHCLASTAPFVNDRMVSRLRRLSARYC
jgi:hypothetical protein